MRPGTSNKVISLILGLTLSGVLSAQISPGDLSSPHEHLEGLTNCTKCHELGNRITGEKCLECHTEIRERITAGRGYHSSAVVKGKQCIACHNEHHGKNFRLINMNTEKFDHNLTGYALSEPHSKTVCRDCHDPKFITDNKLREKKSTWMGVGRECLNCHTDYHLNTLSSSCLNCHNPTSFKTAPNFSHDDAKFKLAGKHKDVECIDCHKIEMVNGSKFQEFRGVGYASCTNCHKDPHTNKFGQNCRKCHTEQSFTLIKGMSDFDHSKTSFPLEGKHAGIDCKTCHKDRLAGSLKHDRCTDCHSDYHKGELAKNGTSPDCNECHTVKGFTSFSYTMEKHNSVFPLNGAHAAQPCFACHRKKEEWKFSFAATGCRDCHNDIHKTFISTKYYPDENCLVCHKESSWTNVSFDHKQTKFQLTGAHIKQECSSCHLSGRKDGKMIQRFAGLPADCLSCHNDIHQGQFGTESCNDCHGTDSWKSGKFDHNKTAFRLDGEHVNVACAECHKLQVIGTKSFIQYKLKDHRCESCHF